MYSDLSILCRGGVPVSISGADRCEMRKIFGSHRQRATHLGSSRLLKELTELFGRDYENECRCARDVAPGMPCVRGHMDVIARIRSDPCVILSVLPQTLYLARDNEKILCISVRVKWNRDAWWDCAPEYREVTLCVLWRRQKFHCWSKKFENFTSTRILLKTMRFSSFKIYIAFPCYKSIFTWFYLFRACIAIKIKTGVNLLCLQRAVGSIGNGIYETLML